MKNFLRILALLVTICSEPVFAEKPTTIDEELLDELVGKDYFVDFRVSQLMFDQKGLYLAVMIFKISNQACCLAFSMQLF